MKTLLPVLLLVACSDVYDPSSLDAGPAHDVAGAPALAALTITANNSCLHATACFRSDAPSIASDSSPKRACMRGYLKKKTNDLFLCDPASGQTDKCYRGGKFTAPDLYHATRCFDMQSPMNVGGGVIYERACSLMRKGNPNNGGSGETREAYMFYTRNLDRCELFENGANAPTQQVRYGENRLYSPPPSGCHMEAFQPPPGVSCPAGTVSIGSGLCARTKC